jgi:hypothetical protein
MDRRSTTVAYSPPVAPPRLKEQNMKRQLALVLACAVTATAAVAQPPQPPGFGPGGPPQGANAGQLPGGPGGPPPNALFNVIDADGDGVITSRELRRAVAALKKLDLDGDGKITLEEANSSAGGPSAMGGPGAYGGRAGGGNGAGGFNSDPRPGGPNLSQYDRNADGVLSPDEVPTQMMGMVRGSDRNGNGVLDPDEIALIQQRMSERVRGQRSLPPGVNVGPQGVERVPR